MNRIMDQWTVAIAGPGDDPSGWDGGGGWTGKGDRSHGG